MRNFIAACLVAGTSMMSPMVVGASTVVGNLVNNGVYNMVGGPFAYTEIFSGPDMIGNTPGVREFTFKNLNTVSQNLMLTTATVNALTGKFTGGISFKWLISGASLNVSEASTTFSNSLDNLIAANAFDTLRITFGDPANRTRPGGTAQFDVQLDASPVPLPAGGLLLLGALGGIAALRRRKTV